MSFVAVFDAELSEEEVAAAAAGSSDLDGADIATAPPSATGAQRVPRTSPSTVVVTTLVTAGLIPGTGTAGASAPNTAGQSNPSTTISVLGRPPLNPTFSTLRDMSVSSGPPQGSVPAGRSLSPQRVLIEPYTVKDNWKNKFGNGVTERWGAAGRFGFFHHVYDHNLGAAMVQDVTRSPWSRNAFVSGQKYNWTATTYRFRCNSTGYCIQIDHRDLLVGVDYRMLGDNHNLGVVTGFCVGEQRCPDWVDARK